VGADGSEDDDIVVKVKGEAICHPERQRGFFWPNVTVSRLYSRLQIPR
jgi:hypothetical protein